MKIGRLNHIGVATASIADSIAFYRDVMGAMKIHPHSTRRRIALGLRKLRTKQLEYPWKKHDNIPL